MEMRELGKTGDKISAIGVGCWAAGGTGWGGTNDIETTAAFYHAISLGINLFDTAPAYGFGHAERVLGEVLKTRRSEVFLATKFGLVWEQELQESIKPNLRPSSIKAECDASLLRLQTDVIDLYQCHWPLPDGKMTRTVCEDMMAALVTLRDAGKVRHFGVSNFTINQMEMCGGGKALAALQPPFSILRPAAGMELIPYCKEQGIGVLCYSPLFRGLLTGKYKGEEKFPEGDLRGKHPDYTGEKFKEICTRVQQLAPIAKAKDTTITGVSLNWVLSTPGVTVALSGTRKKEQIAEATKGQGWSLTPEEMCKISGILQDVTKA